MTREEFEALLEEAFMAGYEDAYDEIDVANESKNVKQKIDKYKDTSLTGKKRGIDGFTMYDPKKIKTQNKKWLNDADTHHTNQTMDGSNDFYFVHRNKGANGKSSTPRGRIKVGNDDELEYRMKRKLKGNALKDDIKELKSLREDFEFLLEEAFMAGYEDAEEELFIEMDLANKKDFRRTVQDPKNKNMTPEQKRLFARHLAAKDLADKAKAKRVALDNVYKQGTNEKRNALLGKESRYRFKSSKALYDADNSGPTIH